MAKQTTKQAETVVEATEEQTEKADGRKGPRGPRGPEIDWNKNGRAKVLLKAIKGGTSTIPELVKYLQSHTAFNEIISHNGKMYQVSDLVNPTRVMGVLKKAQRQSEKDGNLAVLSIVQSVQTSKRQVLDLADFD